MLKVWNKSFKLANCFSSSACHASDKNEATKINSWKKDVVIMPVQTTSDDIRRTHRLCKDGFYVSHRIYIKKIPEKYTLEPIKTYRTGGSDVITGERKFKRVGGGLPINWYFVDFKRVGPTSGPPLVEKVLEIFPSRDRTSFIALVGHADIKRYILASENMNVGDLISTYGQLPVLSINGKDGDAHPCGALTVGTLVHNIEIVPGEGGIYCRAAGSSAKIMNRSGERVILRLPSEQEISVDKRCMCTVGKVSHVTHKDEKLSHPVDSRDLGIRPSSGLWQRKDGYCGRKIRPPKPVQIKDGQKHTPLNIMNYTYMNWSLTE